MRQVLRFYAMHDLDLLGLRLQGVALSSLAKTALEAYANGKRIHIFLNDYKEMDLYSSILQRKGSEVSAYKCEFVTHDTEAEKLLKSVKKRFRNQFLKTLMRNTLTEQVFTPFFDDRSYIDSENAYLKGVNTDYITNLVPTPTRLRKVNVYDYLIEPKKIDVEENNEAEKTKVFKEIITPTATEQDTIDMITYTESNDDSAESDIAENISELFDSLICEL